MSILAAAVFMFLSAWSMYKFFNETDYARQFNYMGMSIMFSIALVLSVAYSVMAEVMK